MTEKMRLIPERLIKCLENPGFIREVRDRMNSSKNKFNAYEDVEADMERYFGRRKFKDFASFRVIETRFNAKQRQTQQK